MPGREHGPANAGAGQGKDAEPVVMRDEHPGRGGSLGREEAIAAWLLIAVRVRRQRVADDLSPALRQDRLPDQRAFARRLDRPTVGRGANGDGPLRLGRPAGDVIEREPGAGAALVRVRGLGVAPGAELERLPVVADSRLPE